MVTTPRTMASVSDLRTCISSSFVPSSSSVLASSSGPVLPSACSSIYPKSKTGCLSAYRPIIPPKPSYLGFSPTTLFRLLWGTKPSRGAMKRSHRRIWFPTIVRGCDIWFPAVCRCSIRFSVIVYGSMFGCLGK